MSDFEPIDLLLAQGTAEELDAMRAALAEDPLRTVAMAETVECIERLRELRVLPSPRFADRMAVVALRAQLRAERRRRPAPTPWWTIALTAAAAVLTFWCCLQTDPLSLTKRAAGGTGAAVMVATEGDDFAAAVVPLRDAGWQRMVDEVRGRLAIEASPHLRDAFETGLRDAHDPLARWLDPRNAVMLSRFDHELRAHREVRAEALRQSGALVAVDSRVQRLADGLVPALSDAGADVATLSMGIRALIAAGPTAARGAAIDAAAMLLIARLPDLHGERLVWALAGLVEAAAVGDRFWAEIEAHGARLVDEVLLPGEPWSWRRPELVAGRVPSTVLAEAGRLLERLPAFGGDVERCTLVRQLLLGHLRERRDVGQDRPEVLAGMLYGSADLLEPSERLRIEQQVRRWRLVHLAPDYATVQQLAWSVTPGRRGYARMQGEMRALAALPEPVTASDRAAFCLCLATSYASGSGRLAPLLVARS